MSVWTPLWRIALQNSFLLSYCLFFPYTHACQTHFMIMIIVMCKNFSWRWCKDVTFVMKMIITHNHFHCFARARVHVHTCTQTVQRSHFTLSSFAPRACPIITEKLAYERKIWEFCEGISVIIVSKQQSIVLPKAVFWVFCYLHKRLDEKIRCYYILWSL